MTDQIAKLKRRVRQLERARDGWRRRCAAKQDHIRYLRVKARDLANSRERWRSLALGPKAPDVPDASKPVLLPLPAPTEGPPGGEPECG
jgi:hypothetical protein